MAAEAGTARVREAACSCGQLKVVVTGEPARVYVCHCLACQRRTGSAFGVQARFDEAQAQVQGEGRAFTRVGDAGSVITFYFCPQCGATVYFLIEGRAGAVIIPVGAFAEPGFPPPTVSIYEERQHPWVGVGGEVEHLP